MGYPPKVQAMLERLKLIKTDLSDVHMMVSLEGVKDLPETLEILSSINSEDKMRLQAILHHSFEKRDLTKISALFSYVSLFSELDQMEIKNEVAQDFQVYLKAYQDENDLNRIFTHPGFSSLIIALNSKDLTDLQFELFSFFHLDNKTNTGKKLAKIQKTLPLSEDQHEQVNRYLDEIKAEIEQNATEEKKRNKTALVLVLIGIVLIIRVLLRLARD
ncbi:MAG: hypothetical protein IT221_11935 [Fluviicola sp.]|nr:hypothetical protein [Fluviicola sp.]